MGFADYNISYTPCTCDLAEYFACSVRTHSLHSFQLLKDISFSFVITRTQKKYHLLISGSEHRCQLDESRPH